MKAEHAEINLIRALAEAAAALEKSNKGLPLEKQVYLDIEGALGLITPAWRYYAEDLYCPDNCHDLMDCYTQTVKPRAGAVIVSQWGDRYTIEESDAEAGLILEIIPGEGTLFFDMREPEEWIKIADLGRYRGEMTEAEGGCKISGDLAAEAAHRLTEALEAGGPCMMLPTDLQPEEAPDLEELPF